MIARLIFEKRVVPSPRRSMAPGPSFSITTSAVFAAPGTSPGPAAT